MKNKGLAGALIASLSLPVLFLSISAPVANAETAGVSSSIATIENCKWFMAGIPGSIAMTASNDAQFNGDALSVSTTITSPTLGLSGSVSSIIAGDPGTECSFYNYVLNASVSAEITSFSFEASYGPTGTETDDDGMDFELGTVDGVTTFLSFELDATSCNPAGADGWRNTGFEFTAPAKVELFAYISVTDEYDAGDAPICAPSTIVSLEIPARNSVPAGAGELYTFAGPTVTFTSTPSNSFNYVGKTE